MKSFTVRALWVGMYTVTGNRFSRQLNREICRRKALQQVNDDGGRNEKFLPLFFHTHVTAGHEAFCNVIIADITAV